MTVMTMTARSALAAARDLRTRMSGRVAMLGDDDYVRARRLWNGAVNHYPALFALCETSLDVQAAVRVARAHGLPLSVRGGGHDWAGRALCHDGLVIDMSRMRAVSIDAEAQIATVAGGALAMDVVTAAAPHDLLAVTGNCGMAGMTGLTLGGGYGPLSPRYGLAVDNLLGAEVILADGRRVCADELEHSDLFWALRGGGGNFGVVTSMRMRLHRSRKLLAGMILFPWSEAEMVLRRYAEVVAWPCDELEVMAGVLAGPNGGPVLFLAPTWSGESAQGELVIDGLRHLGTALWEDVGPMACTDLMAMYDDHAVSGRHYLVQTRWLADITPDVISAIVAAGNAMASPFSAIVLYHFHGEGTRVPLEATAFGLRREHFRVDIVAAWEPGVAGDDSSIHRTWARTLSQVLARGALPGGYANLLGPDEHEQIAMAYGNNLPRLQDLKQRFDPDGVFSSAIPLPARKRRRTAGNILPIKSD